MKTTKEDLIKANERLTNKVNQLESEDLRIREVFSNLLDSYTYETDFYGGKKEKKIIVESWEGIAFLMGELKADADYSCSIQDREDLKREVSLLQGKINDLENPNKYKEF
jgi:hypothetical protein